MEGFTIRGFHLVLPGCRWPYELGFPHRVGRYGLGGPPFSSQACWICRYLEGFMIRGWDLILTGWCWVHELPGWGFHTVGGGIDRGDHRFCPRFVKIV